MTALAVGLGMLTLAAVIYVLGSRWLALQERELTGEDPVSKRGRAPKIEDADDPPALARAIRKGPEEQLAAEIEAWRQEQRDAGYDDEEIQQMLANREPHLFI